MKNIVITLAFVLSLFISPVNYAQERTASGNLMQEANWNSLKSLVDAASKKVDMMQAQIDKIAECGTAGMVYAPGETSTSINGCKKTNATLAPFVVTAAGSNEQAIAQCPSTAVRIGCAGARDVNLSDGCREESCGVMGAIPYGANGCLMRNTNDGGRKANERALTPVAYAFCTPK
ncbi:MAG: hypothetical protein DI628_07180 [Blastochloris viridis]|uniref:DUF3617 family protein n=1 Tax=Blastochloris viridis TaxID=1079 RepID=A0A6N4QZD9_BLAVI|nr:MAG: hypothetical protein DI628_07180 [Blastochloris viridis]